MKYLLLLLVVIVMALLVIAYLFPNKYNLEYTKAIEHQESSFFASKDSSEIIWERGKEFLNLHINQIAGGNPRNNDSVLFIPYSNSYQKGNSVIISRSIFGNKVLFTCQWWYSKKLQENGSKEIAIFMQHHISKY